MCRDTSIYAPFLSIYEYSMRPLLFLLTYLRVLYIGVTRFKVPAR